MESAGGLGGDTPGPRPGSWPDRTEKTGGEGCCLLMLAPTLTPVLAPVLVLLSLLLCSKPGEGRVNDESLVRST